jgi:hypothetical protein
MATLTLFRNNTEQRWRDTAPGLAPNVAENLAKIAGIVAEFNGKRERIRADRDLSPEGKSKALTALGVQARETLGSWAHGSGQGHDKGKLGGLAQHIADLQAKLMRSDEGPRGDATDRLLHELRLREVRDQLRAVERSMRTVLVIESDDPLVIEAARTAPASVEIVPGESGASTVRLVPFVDQQALTSKLLARAAATSPEVAQEIEQLETMRYDLESAFVMARADIEEAASLPPLPRIQP